MCGQTRYLNVLLASKSALNVEVEHKAPDISRWPQHSPSCAERVRTVDSDWGQHFQSRHGRIQPHERLAVQENTVRPSPLGSLDSNMRTCLG